MDDEQILTVGDLKHKLAAWPDDARVIFGWTEAGRRLAFYRFKNRSSRDQMDLLQIELNEVDD